MADGGHSFVKKTFHKPTYCHHCSDLLWGLIGQGYICEVCNFIIHERCVTSVVTPCSGIAPCIIKNPVAHCWSEPTHHKRKFCTVCRKRLDETPAVHCLVCEYFAHIECQDFAVPDCTENATYVPGKELLNVKHQHHWREGNLPPTSKCAFCKKTCWSSECLTGYRCEWCGMTTHGACRMYLPIECNFGILQPIYLPPHSVSIPRTEVPIEAIIGVQVKSKTTLVRDYSCPELRTIGLCDDATVSDMPVSQNTVQRKRRTNSRTFSLSSSPSKFDRTASPITLLKNQRQKQQQDHLSSALYEKNHSKKSSSSPSRSLHLLYANIFYRKDTDRRHAKNNTCQTNTEEGDDNEDIGICDISAGDISDDYDHCDIVIKKKNNKIDGIDGSSIEYHGDADEADTAPNECFYETSDTGGDQTTADDIDIDSSTNLLSNLSCNSSNSNTSIDRRNISCNNSYNNNNDTKQAFINVAATATTVTTVNWNNARNEKITSESLGGLRLDVSGAGSSRKRGSSGHPPPKGLKSSCVSSALRIPSDGGNGGAITSANSTSDCSSAVGSPVGRSKSFQEPGVKTSTSTFLTTRGKKYSRFFTRRRSRKRSTNIAASANSRSNNINNNCRSNFSLDTVSQNVEITIQDVDGNYQQYDDNYYALNWRNRSRRHRTDSDDIDYYIKNGEDDNRDDDCDGDDDERIHLDLDNRRTRCCSSDGSEGGGSSSRQSTKNKHMLGRLMTRMRRLSLSWRKPHYKNRRARSISEEFSSGDTPRFKDDESCSKTESIPGGSGGAGCSSGGSSHYRVESAHKSEKDKEKKEKEREEKDIEMIKVFDGNSSLRRQLYRVIIIPRTCSLEYLLTSALRAFHITRDPSAFYLTDLYASDGNEETPLQDPNPVLTLTHLEGKRPAIHLRFHDKDCGFVRVYPGKLQSSLDDPYVSVPVDNTTIIKDLIRDALDKFGLQDNQIQDYRCSEVLLDRGVTERILSLNERPWDIMKHLGNDSIRQMELMRFYMQHKQDPHGPNIALFVGNLPPGLSQRNYEQILNRYVTEENKFTSIGPIYYEYGCVVLTFEDTQRAVRAFYNLRETIIEDKKLQVLLLPNIEPSMVPPDVRPLLVFVNVKSGGCQGLELISSFRKLLNPYQVFDLDNGGPLPGLYVFRQITNYKILVCGGDGTIGWVLQCLDNVGQDSECSSPPCAIVPLGTGNDLARVLCWGSGYTGGEDPLNLLRDVIEAEEIRLDRWTVVFHPEDKPEETTSKATSSSNSTGKKKKAHQAHLSQQTNQHHQLPAITSSDISGGGAQNEDNSQIYVMNNYFGIGVDADLCLDFHNAREENPNKFNSRLHNKSYYVKMGLRKIVNRKSVKELHKELRLEVDGKVVDLPPVEGIIILNILSWGSGANPWGPDKDDHFTTPNHYDGVLEIVGVTGVVHLGQIQSGIRTAMRIAQGGHIKIHMYSDLPVQVDGEPWVQGPGDCVVLKSALKATMLKKNKGKMKRRNTEPAMIVAGSPAPPMSLAIHQASGQPLEENNAEIAQNNTDF